MNTLKFLVVVSIALLSTDLIYHQVVNGQTEGEVRNQTGELPAGCDPNAPSTPAYCLNDSNSIKIYESNNQSSRVDKLINDTKREIEDKERQGAIEESYRAELVKRMENTDCLSAWIMGKFTPLNPDSLPTNEIEDMLKTCVERGLVR